MPKSASGGSAPKPAGKGRLALRALWGRRLPLTISFALTIAALAVYLLTFVGEKPTPIFEFIDRLELNALDTRFRMRPARYSHPDSRIIIVDIDQRSQEVLGRWPFSRAYFAQMMDALHEDGASVVALRHHLQQAGRIVRARPRIDCAHRTAGAATGRAARPARLAGSRAPRS